MPDNQPHGGDPDGRLLAARQAQNLAEAGRIAEVLHLLLRRADVSEELPMGDVLAGIKRLEAASLRRAHGQIGGRRRLKRRGGSGNPLRDNLPRNHLFIDESGLPDGAATNQDVFALGAISMSPEQMANYISAADQLKRKFFGDISATFHARDLSRGTGRFGFERDGMKRERFQVAVGELIQDSAFTAFGIGIRKRAYAREFKDAGIDPYLPTNVYSLAIMLLLERYVDYLWAEENQPLGELTFEAQGPREDVQHQAFIADTILNGTQWVSGAAFQSHLLPGASFLPKSGSHPLELSDLLAYDLHQWIRSGCAGAPGYWRIWTEKFYAREDLRMGRFGLKIFPDSDIRDRIEEHRDRLRQ